MLKFALKALNFSILRILEQCKHRDSRFVSNSFYRLEASLRKFSCMTVGDTICLQYNKKKYLLDVREVKPSDAACIIETDCEVDFEAPADYMPPAAKTAAKAADTPALPYGGMPTYSAKQAATESTGGRPLGSASGLRLNRKNEASGGNSDNMKAMRDARMRKYETFHGTGQSLSGTVKNSTALKSSTVKKEAPAVEKKPDEVEKPVLDPFSGTGRRLR